MKSPTFGSTFKSLRLEKNFTQTQFANDFNVKMESKGFTVSDAGVSHYENDRRTPENALLAALADYFGVSIDYLMARTSIRKKDMDAELSSSIKEMLFANGIIESVDEQLTEEKMIELKTLFGKVLDIYSMK